LRSGLVKTVSINFSSLNIEYRSLRLQGLICLADLPEQGECLYPKNNTRGSTKTLMEFPLGVMQEYFSVIWTNCRLIDDGDWIFCLLYLLG